MQDETLFAALAANGDAVPGFVEESLRRDSPVQRTTRRTSRDLEVGGVHLPAGSWVEMGIGSANRDERKYPRAEVFDISRNPRDHIGFGYGLHSCLGAALARLEARVAMEELLALMPEYEVDEPGTRRVHSPNVRGYSRLPVVFARPLGRR